LADRLDFSRARRENRSFIREERQLVDRVVEQATRSEFREREEVAVMGLTVAEQLKAEGELHACRQILRLQLEERFGSLPADLEREIESIDDLQRLRAGLRQVLHVKSLAELEL
jgi:hypothetical protein